MRGLLGRAPTRVLSHRGAIGRRLEVDHEWDRRRWRWVALALGSPRRGQPSFFGRRLCLGKMNAPVNHALLDRMVSDRAITPEQREAALSHVQAFGDRVEEALLESGVDEQALLKYLA